MPQFLNPNTLPLLRFETLACVQMDAVRYLLCPETFDVEGFIDQLVGECLNAKRGHQVSDTPDTFWLTTEDLPDSDLPNMEVLIDLSEMPGVIIVVSIRFLAAAALAA